MLLVNETGVPVQYWVSSAGMADCGSIAVDGVANLPGYDNQTNVTVEFLPSAGGGDFEVTIPQSQTGNQVEMALVAP